MEVGRLICAAFFLACTGLCTAKPQELVFLESSHDLEAWRAEGWEKAERLSPSEDVFLTFALKQRNLESLERHFWQVSDPKSSEYGKHLSLSNLTQLVSPSEATTSTINLWLRRHGIQQSDCTTILTGDFLTCRMSCAAAEALLVGAKFHRFRHTKLTRPVIRSTHLYSVPKTVSPHLDFVGGVLHFPAVNGPSSPKVNEYALFEIEKKPSVRGQVHIGVYPSVLRERYNVSDVVGTHPKNLQSVAQFLEQYYSPSDLKEFLALWGGSFKHLEEMAKVIGPNSGRSGIEASLDTQYIMSLGAMVPTWFWSTGGRHESQEPFLEWLIDISNRTDVPWVHSVSYSDNEDTLDVTYMNRINVEFQKAGVRGLTFLFASGDNGAGCKKKKFRPMFPSSSPYVTTVGGTAFNDPFTVSDEYAYDISGGGFSNVFDRPSYQTDVVENYLKTGPHIPAASYFNQAGRGFPDIAVKLSLDLSGAARRGATVMPCFAIGRDRNGVCGIPWPWKWWSHDEPHLVQQRSGRWVLAAIGGSPREGGYTFKKLDESSGLLLDGGEEVARVICKSLSHEELKRTRSAKGHDLTGVTITKSEVMQEMQKASNEGAYFVLPSQLNGVDAPSPERVLKSLEECKSDATLFERRGIRGHLALHPAVSQFLLDNARGTSRGSGLNSVGKVLESINSDRLEFQNGYLRVRPESEESLRVLVANLHKTQPLILEDVPVVGLQHSKLFTSSFHLVHVAFASACPLDQRHRSDNFHEELSRSILSVQYLGALRRAAEKAAENARQKVFLVPPGDPGEKYFYSRISESMSRAVALLGPEDFRKLEVHILLEESDFDEFCSELMFYGVNLCS